MDHYVLLMYYCVIICIAYYVQGAKVPNFQWSLSHQCHTNYLLRPSGQVAISQKSCCLLLSEGWGLPTLCKYANHLSFLPRLHVCFLHIFSYENLGFANINKSGIEGKCGVEGSNLHPLFCFSS